MYACFVWADTYRPYGRPCRLTGIIYLHESGETARGRSPPSFRAATLHTQPEHSGQVGLARPEQPWAFYSILFYFPVAETNLACTCTLTTPSYVATYEYIHPSSLYTNSLAPGRPPPHRAIRILIRLIETTVTYPLTYNIARQPSQLVRQPVNTYICRYVDT